MHHHVSCLRLLYSPPVRFHFWNSSQTPELGAQGIREVKLIDTFHLHHARQVIVMSLELIISPFLDLLVFMMSIAAITAVA